MLSSCVRLRHGMAWNLELHNSSRKHHPSGFRGKKNLEDSLSCSSSYPLVIKHGNGKSSWEKVLIGKSAINSVFSIAMFDYWRVFVFCPDEEIRQWPSQAWCNSRGTAWMWMRWPWGLAGGIPHGTGGKKHVVMTSIAIEHGHTNSDCSYQRGINIMVFHD